MLPPQNVELVETLPATAVTVAMDTAEPAVIVVASTVVEAATYQTAVESVAIKRTKAIDRNATRYIKSKKAPLVTEERDPR